jgi:chorismate-pyruvate lyase
MAGTMNAVESTQFPLVTVGSHLWPKDAVATVIPPQQIPQPYRDLLAHTEHMTVTVEAFYDDAVDVLVLESGRDEELYHRRILLALHGSRKIVQYGIVRINLKCCSAEVRGAILEQKTPLGRILIEHNVLRRIEPTSFLRIDPDPSIAGALECDQVPLYGRTGVIFCDDQPAIAVLEILTPVDSK